MAVVFEEKDIRNAELLFAFDPHIFVNKMIDGSVIGATVNVPGTEWGEALFLYPLSIEKEDGSGKCWNVVSLMPSVGKKGAWYASFFVRTGQKVVHNVHLKRQIIG